MKERHQTPQKIFVRTAENRNGRTKDFPSKKFNKIKFTSVSEDSVDLSPISEISDANRDDIVTNLLEEPSSVTLLPCDVTPSKNISEAMGFGSPTCFGDCELDSSKFASVETEIAVNFLRNFKHEVFNDAPHCSKLMEVIIEHVIHDLHSHITLPEEKDHFAHVLSMKNQMLFLCTFIWIIVVVLFFISDVGSPYIGPLPT